MDLIQEFFHHQNLRLDGLVMRREAVRAIILEADQVLMVYSSVNKDYKFPGGGIKDGENHKEALLREVREECGLVIAEIVDPFGFIREYSKALEKEFDVFKQTSYYYLCTVQRDYLGLNLDEYEEQLGFGPEWVSIDKALAKNRLVLNGDFGKPPRWTLRDTFVLTHLSVRGSKYDSFT